MFSVTGEIYDAIYGFKDHASEALKIRHLNRAGTARCQDDSGYRLRHGRACQVFVGRF